MSTKKASVIEEPKTDMVKVKGLRNEDVAVIVNGECRVIPMGREVSVEKRFADEFERSERAKDSFFRQAMKMESAEIA